MEAPDDVARAIPMTHPDGALGLIMTGGSLAVAVLLWAWVATQAPGTFHDQGGMIITLIVLPCTITLWIAGGPVALIIGLRARAELRSKPGQWSGERLLRVGILLSSLTFLSGVGLGAWNALMWATSAGPR